MKQILRLRKMCTLLMSEPDRILARHKVGCRGRAYTPEIQCAHKSQSDFAEIQTRPNRAVKALVPLGMCLLIGLIAQTRRHARFRTRTREV